MVIVDSVIDENITKLNTEIGTFDSTLKTLIGLKTAFTKIQKFEKRIPNNSGGYDIIPTIPNPNGLSEDDNKKIREIIYDDSMKKFSKLNL